ncbi:MAG TPA: hypothetical protein VF265_02270 [Nevskiaceae bacterium]
MSRTEYYTRMASSGLFLGDRREIRMLPYGRSAVEEVVADYRSGRADAALPEAFATFRKADEHPEGVADGEAAVQAVAGVCAALGLRFPSLTLT